MIDDTPDFLADLHALNAHLRAGLKAAGCEPVVNGNVCHATSDEFAVDHLSERMRPKRAALAGLAARSQTFVEVGVAGGHGLLVALHANPDLTCIGVDHALREKPSWPPVDILVPLAMDWLKRRFGPRISFERRPALEGLRACAARPGLAVDLVHLDAGKSERQAELEAIAPALSPRAVLIQGDALNGDVRRSSTEMESQGLARRLDPRALGLEPQRLYQLLDIAPRPLPAPRSAEDFFGRKLLVAVCHQDDETLFAGGLLQQLRGASTVHIATLFRPAEGRADSATRREAFKKVCSELGAECTQLPFAIEPGQPNLRRYVNLPNDPERLKARPKRPIARHPLFPTLVASVTGLLRQSRADFLLTHNAVGEYGHREHVLLHHAARHAMATCPDVRGLCFGNGMPDADFTIPVAAEAKAPLYDLYLPQWNGRARYSFALEDECFIDMPTA